ncbi:hypothetical protein L6164_007656 [Bauhinia variegata]|uniref:Uncharacterized protein n=1 Tax=Bauhinia variegata TaxID=167791 RepID=A0ACB9PEA4_BAUVA|nr:hypothetical protein L6164_007656 [Bauhinia variegata]
MGSKGRIPPPHMRRPVPGPGILHPEPLGPGMRPPPGPFPPYDLLPPPEVMEQKLAAQHVEMQRLATENQRLAATHGTLRQELAAAQHELQILNVQIGTMKAEREQQMKSLTDNIAKMEAELKAAEPHKKELQEARAEAHGLVTSRQELIAKAQQLSQDLQRAHVDVQQIPALIAELDGLRQEYQHCRAAYDYEKKLYSDHLVSLQMMEKNYHSMAREVEKLRAELANNPNVDRRSSGPYGGTPGNNENEASGLPVGQNSYEDGYGHPQGRGSLPASAGAGATTTATAAGAHPGPPHPGAQTGPASARPGYDAPRGPAQWGVAYDAQRMTGYDHTARGSAYDSHRGASFDAQRTGYDPQRGPSYDPHRGPGGPHGHGAMVNNMPYGSATPPGQNDAPARGGNPARR